MTTPSSPTTPTTFAAPNPDDALSFDECEAAGVDGTGRFVGTTCTGTWSSFPVEFNRVPGEWNPFASYDVRLHRCSGCDQVWAIVTDDYTRRQGSYTLSGGTVTDMGGVNETLARFAVANVEATGQV